MTEYISESSKIFNQSFIKQKNKKSKTPYHELPDGDIFNDNSNRYPVKNYYYIRENDKMVKKLFEPSNILDCKNLLSIKCR